MARDDYPGDIVQQCGIQDDEKKYQIKVMKAKLY